MHDRGIAVTIAFRGPKKDFSLPPHVVTVRSAQSFWSLVHQERLLFRLRDLDE